MAQPQWWWLLEPYWTLLRNFSRRASTPPSSLMDSTRPYSWLYRYLLGYMSIYGYHSHQPEHLNKSLCLIMTQWKTNCYLHSVVAYNVKSRLDPVNFVRFLYYSMQNWIWIVPQALQCCKTWEYMSLYSTRLSKAWRCLWTSKMKKPCCRQLPLRSTRKSCHNTQPSWHPLLSRPYVLVNI